MFAAGAALSAGAATAAVPPPKPAGPARRLALAGAACELAAKQLMEHRLAEHGEPYKRGIASKLGHISEVCIALGSLLLARRGGESRVAATAAGALLSAGALSA